MAIARFNITLTHPMPEPAFCKYSLVDGSAGSFVEGLPDKNLVDYTFSKGFVTFEEGQQTATVEVEVNDNVTSDFVKTFYMMLYDAHNCLIDTTPIPCTIIYNGVTTTQDEITSFYSLSSAPAPVDDLPSFFSFLSFSSPESYRWGSLTNIFARNPFWITEGYYSYYSQRNLKYQRLCNAYELIQDQPFGDPQPFNSVMQRTSISTAYKYGIKTITSNHNDSQWCLDGCVGVFGDGIFTEKVFENLLQTQTRVFQDAPGFCGIQLNGEPASVALQGMTTDIFNRFSEIGLSAVREINDQIYVLVDGIGGNPTQFSSLNAGIANIKDPSNRDFIVWDIYLDTYSGGGAPYMDDIMKEGDGYSDYPISAQTGPRRLEWVKPFAEQYGWKFMIGETGGGQQDTKESLSSDSWKEVVTGMTNGCYYENIPMGIWCSGPQFNGYYTDFSGLHENTYPLTLDPFGSTTRYGIYENGPESPVLGQFSRYFEPDISLSWKLIPSVTVNSDNTSVVTVDFPYNPTYSFDINVLDGGANGAFPDGSGATITENLPTQTHAINYTPAKGACCALFSLSETNTDTILVSPSSLQIFFNTDMFVDLGLSPTTVIWPCRLVADYKGPAFSLTKSDGTSPTDFYYTLGGAENGIGATVDPTIVSQFSPDTPLVKTWYDQSGNGADLGPFKGEDSQWGNATTTNPPSTYTDYPRYMMARDVNFYVPHFGGDFGDYDNNDRLYNRMDMTLPIDGEMYYTFFFAFGANIAIGLDDYTFTYAYSQKNFIFGPNSQLNITGESEIVTNVPFVRSQLNIYSVEYNGGSLFSSEDGSTTSESGSLILNFVGGSSGITIGANQSTGEISVTASGSSSSISYTAGHYLVSSGEFNGGMRFVWSDYTYIYVLLTEYWGSARYLIYKKDGYLRICKNGSQIYSDSAEGPIVDQFNGIMNVCWNRFYPSCTVSDIIGFIGVDSAVTDDQRDTIYQNLYSSIQTTIS